MDMQSLSDVHLVVLHKAIKLRLADVEHNVSWLERMIERDASYKDYSKRLAVATAEQEALQELLSLFAKDILLRGYKT